MNLNEQALEAAAKSLYEHFKNQAANGGEKWQEWNELDEIARSVATDDATAAIAAYLAALTDAVTTFTDVNSLPDRSVILDRHGDACQRRGDWWYSHEVAPMASRQVAKYLPATVLHAGGTK